MTGELIALLSDREIGRIRRDARGRLTFTYDDRWRRSKEAFPLSISMPLAAAEHRPAVTEAFLWGLLPDNEFILEKWAKKFQVSARSVFALLAEVGEDCAGAVQFLTPERLSEIASRTNDRVDWLTENEIAQRLRILREDHAAWRLPNDTGQFSLAGAQPKTALLLANGKWGLPSGRRATTHILKPPTGQFDGHAENEHVCLSLARSLGIPAVTTQVRRFGNEVAIVVDRYDRQTHGNEVIRIHQEDMCQALGIMPTRKYQNENGPSPGDIVELLRSNSSEREADVASFVQAIAFNWLIAGPDAHAKNYALLIAAGPRIRLAPLYDIASVLPYDEFDIGKAKLAMKIGGEYRLRDIGLRQWLKFAREIRIDEEAIISHLRSMASAIPDHLERICKEAVGSGLDRKILGRLAQRLSGRAGACLKLLTDATARGG